VDTGFIVCNPRNYPGFYRFLDQLGVERRDSDMSFGFRCERTRLGYVGPRLRQFLSSPANLLRPCFVRMLVEQRRFNARALRDLQSGAVRECGLGEYFKQLGLSAFFVQSYLVPLAASVWSSPDAGIYDFPAETFIRFFNNHGMLDLSKLPRWQTVAGGSWSYVKAFARAFNGRIRLGMPVLQVRRGGDRVRLALPEEGFVEFDRVVLAAHADQSLAMLCDPSDGERTLLGAWSYHRNHTVLHCDPSVMPASRRLWASWNYLRPKQEERAASPVAITYHMNRLQGLRTAEDYFVTLNQSERIREDRVVYQVDYDHPVYTPAAVAAQAGLREIQGIRGTYYAGAYMRYGFHEDGVASALDVCSRFGLAL